MIDQIGEFVLGSQVKSGIIRPMLDSRPIVVNAWDKFPIVISVCNLVYGNIAVESAVFI